MTCTCIVRLKEVTPVRSMVNMIIIMSIIMLVLWFALALLLVGLNILAAVIVPA